MGASVQPLPPIQDALAAIRAKASSGSALPPIQEALAKIRSAAVPDVRQVSDVTQVRGHNPPKPLTPQPRLTPTMDAGTSALLGVGSGVTANFMDEILGGIDAANSVLPKWAGGEGKSLSQLGQSYEAGRQKVLAAEQQGRAAHPTATVLGNLAGAVLPAVTSGGAGLTTSLGLKGIPAAAAEGAAYGGLAGVGAGSGAVNRLKRGAGGAVLGGVGGALTGAAAKGIANLADRTGATDAIAQGVEKVNPSMAAKLGTRGQVNDVLAERQDILDALGDQGQSAGSQQLERVAATKATAKTLYDAARADKQVIQDPELNTLLADPDVQKVYQTVAKIRASSGNPLPTVAAPEQVPLALQKMGVSPERYQELLKVGASRSRIPALTGTDILPEELSGAQSGGVQLPDPDALSRTRRALWDVANGYQNSPLAIKQDEAQALLPKVDAIRAKLHDLSPLWQQADKFYAGAKGEEEAFSAGFDAFRNAANQTGATLTENSPEAMLKAISEPRYPNEPAEALTARAQAFREGMRAAAVGQVKGAPVDARLQSVLSGSAFSPTQSGQQLRSLMFQESAPAQTLEQLLAEARGTSLSKTGGSGFASAPINKNSILRSVYRGITQPPNLLSTPQGQQLLSARLGSPDLLQSELSLLEAAGKSGNGLSALLGRIVPAATNERNLPTRQGP